MLESKASKYDIFFIVDVDLYDTKTSLYRSWECVVWPCPFAREEGRVW